MALAKCPDCKKLVSSRVETCPFCGCPAEFFEEASADELEEIKGKELAPKEETEKKQVKRHVFSIEKVGDIYALFMIDDEGNEIRLSENKECYSVMGCCETDQYVFYVVAPDVKPTTYAGGFSSYSNKSLYRYDKKTKTNEKIVDKFSGESNCKSYDLGENCNDAGERIVFAGSNLLFFADFYGLHRMDFDGKNDRVIVEGEQVRNIRIKWVYDNCVWYTSGSDSDYLMMYSLSSKQSEMISNYKPLCCTNGEIVYVCGAGKIFKININGTGKEEIATYSMDSIVVHIWDMNIVDGNLVFRAGNGMSTNEQYEIHKGDRYMFK